MTDGIFTPEVKADIRARAKSYRDREAQEKEALVIDIDRARAIIASLEADREYLQNCFSKEVEETVKLRRLCIELGYHYAMSLPADSWEDRVWAVVKDVGLLKAIRDEVDATADKHEEWR